jgi:predicted enzyme related to lactoylglutathione lyase
MEIDGIRMGQFPNDGEDVFVQVIHGAEYRPSADGVVVYFNCGDDLQQVAANVAANGGRIIIPKTEIGPGMGFYAMFTDTEGNKLGLHSTS